MNNGRGGRGIALGLAVAATPAWLLFAAPVLADGGELDRPWARHTIDDSSRGADGVRLGDVNGDGLPDIVTGWEEGGRVRVYVHPGKSAVKRRWPAVTVGEVTQPEDAVFADLDGDGALDVVRLDRGRDADDFRSLGAEREGPLP